MTEQITRIIPESDVIAWHRAGWHFVGVNPTDNDTCVMLWDRPGDPVQPLKDDEPRAVASAVAALEGSNP